MSIYVFFVHGYAGVSTGSLNLANMISPRNQEEFLQKVGMYLDNELPRESERELLREIQSNPAYYDILSKERAFREFIKSKVQRRTVSPTLVSSIKEKIGIK